MKPLLFLLLGISLLAAGCIGDEGGTSEPIGTDADDGTDDDDANATASGLQATKTFNGVITGVGTPVLSVSSGTGAGTIPAPDNATTALFELTWDALPTATEINLVLCEGECDDTSSNQFASASAASAPLAMEVKIPSGGVIGYNVFHQGAGAETSFDGVASFFAGSVPSGYSALGDSGE